MPTDIDPLPMPPGTSPFHVKGTTYLAMQDYVREHVPGGIDAVCAHLDDAALATFVRQMFLPVGQYDALPIRPFAQAIALHAGVPFGESVSQRARWLAERDVTVVHRLLFKLVSPETIVVERLPKVALRYFDFGHATGKLVGSRRAEFQVAGLPTLLAQWFLAMMQGYVPFALERAGARNPVLRAGTITKDGEKNGIETSTLTCSASWG